MHVNEEHFKSLHSNNKDPYGLAQICTWGLAQDP